jgi:hypothetical protein
MGWRIRRESNPHHAGLEPGARPSDGSVDGGLGRDRTSDELACSGVTARPITALAPTRRLAPIRKSMKSISQGGLGGETRTHSLRAPNAAVYRVDNTPRCDRWSGGQRLHDSGIVHELLKSGNGLGCPTSTTLRPQGLDGCSRSVSRYLIAGELVVVPTVPPATNDRAAEQRPRLPDITPGAAHGALHFGCSFCGASSRDTSSA